MAKKETGNNLVDAHVWILYTVLAVTGLICASGKIALEERMLGIHFSSHQVFKGAEGTVAKPGVMALDFGKLIGVRNAADYDEAVIGLDLVNSWVWTAAHAPDIRGLIWKENAPQGDFLAGRSRYVRHFTVGFQRIFIGFDRVFPLFGLHHISHLQRWRRTEILDKYFSIDRHSFVVGAKGDNRNGLSADPGTLASNQGILGHVGAFLSSAIQEQRQDDVSEDQDRRTSRPKKLFIVLGFAISLGSLKLLFKVLDYVYLCAGFNIDMAVGGMVLALVLFVCGGFIVLSGFGMLP